MQAFHFFTKPDQTLLLGLRAHSVDELVVGVQSVPAASIYNHSHRFLHPHHSLSPEPPSDTDIFVLFPSRPSWIPLQINHAFSGMPIWWVAATTDSLKQLISAPEFARRMGVKCQEHDRNNLLITRHLKDYLLPLLSRFNDGEVV